MFGAIGNMVPAFGPETPDQQKAYIGGLGVVVVLLVIIVFWFHIFPLVAPFSEGYEVVPGQQNPGQAQLTGKQMASVAASNTNAVITNPTASRSAGMIRDDRFAPTPFPYPSTCAYDPVTGTDMTQSDKALMMAAAQKEGLAKAQNSQTNQWRVSEYMNGGQGQSKDRGLYINPGQQDVIGDSGSVYAGGPKVHAETLQLRAYGAV